MISVAQGIINPFTPKSDQCQNSPAASQEIWHHTVWRTWLFIAYSDEKWLYYKFSLQHSHNRFLKGWENTHFELRSERVKKIFTWLHHGQEWTVTTHASWWPRNIWQTTLWYYCSFSYNQNYVVPGKWAHCLTSGGIKPTPLWAATCKPEIFITVSCNLVKLWQDNSVVNNLQMNQLLEQNSSMINTAGSWHRMNLSYSQGVMCIWNLLGILKFVGIIFQILEVSFPCLSCQEACPKPFSTIWWSKPPLVCPVENHNLGGLKDFQHLSLKTCKKYVHDRVKDKWGVYSNWREGTTISTTVEPRYLELGWFKIPATSSQAGCCLFDRHLVLTRLFQNPSISNYFSCPVGLRKSEVWPYFEDVHTCRKSSVTRMLSTSMYN